MPDATGRTLGDALEAHLRAAGFSQADYRARWAVVPVGPLTVVFPNFAARGRALSLHDLHHALTGYDTTLVGEAELGAFELASGCGRHWVAWVLEHEVFALGLVLAPGRTYRAFVRGRRARNLYGRRQADAALLARPLDEVERELRLDVARPPTARDRVAFGLWAATGALRLAVDAVAYPIVFAPLAVALHACRWLDLARGGAAPAPAGS